MAEADDKSKRRKPAVARGGPRKPSGRPTPAAGGERQADREQIDERAMPVSESGPAGAPLPSDSPRGSNDAASTNDAGRASPRPAELEAQIRERAYLIYESRGYRHGEALEHWLEAEREVLEERGQSARKRTDR